MKIVHIGTTTKKGKKRKEKLTREKLKRQLQKLNYNLWWPK